MDRNEMVKVLMEKADITKEEAEAALDKCDGELLDAIIYLEREGKLKDSKKEFVIEEKKQHKEEKKNDNGCGGIGSVVGRIFKCIGKIIRKGNDNYFEINKDGEKPIRISLTISVLLLIILTAPSLILLVVGLFCGYRYSIVGKSFNCDGVNSVFEGASKSAENIKNDFKEGYSK